MSTAFHIDSCTCSHLRPSSLVVWTLAAFSDGLASIVTLSKHATKKVAQYAAICRPHWVEIHIVKCCSELRCSYAVRTDKADITTAEEMTIIFAFGPAILIFGCEHQSLIRRKSKTLERRFRGSTMQDDRCVKFYLQFLDRYAHKNFPRVSLCRPRFA